MWFELFELFELVKQVELGGTELLSARAAGLQLGPFRTGPETTGGFRRSGSRTPSRGAVLDGAEHPLHLQTVVEGRARLPVLGDRVEQVDRPGG